MARSVLITFFQGLKADIPSLGVGEPGWCTDTKELYVGSASGNIKIGPGAGSGGGDYYEYVSRVCATIDNDGITGIIGGDTLGADFDDWGTGGVVLTGITMEITNSSTGDTTCTDNPQSCCPEDEGSGISTTCCDPAVVGDPAYGFAYLSDVGCAGMSLYVRFTLNRLDPVPAGYERYSTMWGNFTAVPITDQNAEYYGVISGGEGSGGDPVYGWISDWSLIGCAAEPIFILGCIAGTNEYELVTELPPESGNLQAYLFPYTLSSQYICNGSQFKLRISDDPDGASGVNYAYIVNEVLLPLYSDGTQVDNESNFLVYSGD